MPYLYNFGVMVVFILTIWAFRIGHKYLQSQPGTYEKERYLVYGKTIFIPFYVHSLSTDEKLRRECEIWFVALALILVYGFVMFPPEVDLFQVFSSSCK